MYRVIFLILVLTSICFAQNHIKVIYPKDGQQIAPVDSTFIFGNTNPDASLTINGHQISVHEDGGFLAFLPIEQGMFEFELISIAENFTAINRIRIYVGDVFTPDEDVYINHESMSPSGATTLCEDDVLEFSIKAKSGLNLFCSFENDTVLTRMYNQNSVGLNSVFGEVADSVDSNGIENYTGYLSLSSVKDSSLIYYMYENEKFDSTGEFLYTEFELFTSEYYVYKLDELPSRTIKLTGRPHIIRTEPGKGYKLVNQPSGVRFLYSGETPSYYRIKLADGVSGFVRKKDAEIEPLGTQVPRGEVSFITFDNRDDHVLMEMKTGDKLPYEIHTDGNLMTIDIYYLISDTDWIRFNNNSQEYIESVWWSQPQDGIYRLHIKWYDSHFWGYTPGYNDDTFTLRLSKNTMSHGIFSSPVKNLRIAIDPGHSHDDGAVGPTGLTEKNANLWIAHELRQLLLRKGAEVMMTRMGHEHLGIYDRVDIAVEWDADLLISIHNNALPDGINPYTHNGTSVYYYFNQARSLAEAIHKNLIDETGLPDHGLYHGNLALCRVTECPSVLVECAFMMIPEQEAALKTDKFQRKCAKAIYKGIVDYLEKDD